MLKLRTVGLVGTALIIVGACKSAPQDSGTTDGGQGSGGTGTFVNLASGGTDPDAGDAEATGGNANCARDLIDVSKASECGYDENFDPEAACTGGALETEPPYAVLQLVVDVSGSMLYTPEGVPPPAVPNKWQITRDALVTSINQLASTIAVGITYFPNKATPYTTDYEGRTVADCINTDANVPIAPLGSPDSAHRAALIASLNKMTPDPLAGTPTKDAYDLAVQPLFETAMVDPETQKALTGPRYVLLITDGQPTFNEDCIGTGSMEKDKNVTIEFQPIIDSIQGAFDSATNVKTYIIGSPGSEKSVFENEDGRPWLSTAAKAGGTASSPDCVDTGPNYCHFDMATTPNFATALAEGLRKILGQVLPCSYYFELKPGETLDETKIGVYFKLFNGTRYVIPRNAGTECNMGWQLINDKTSVGICGTTCQTIQTYPDAIAEMWLGCKVPTPVF